MTKKHYIKVAAAFKAQRKPIPEKAYLPSGLIAQSYNLALDNMAKELCCIFIMDNGRFDKDKFLTACGVQD